MRWDRQDAKFKMTFGQDQKGSEVEQETEKLTVSRGFSSSGKFPESVHLPGSENAECLATPALPYLSMIFAVLDSLPPRPALAQKSLVSIRALFPNASKVTLEVNSSLIANLQLSRLTFRIRSVNHVDSKYPHVFQIGISTDPYERICTA